MKHCNRQSRVKQVVHRTLEDVEQVGQVYQRIKSTSAFQLLEEPHKEVHCLAKEALQHYEAGKMSEAETVYLQIEEVSDCVVELLTEINKGV